MNKNQTKKIDLILLRGLVREKRHWGSFSKTLQTLNPLIQAIECDLPGTGDFYKESPAWSFKSITKNIELQLQEKYLSPDNIKIIVGLSFGGMCGYELILSNPEKYQALILINSSASDLSSISERISLSFIKEIAPHFFNEQNNKKEEKILNWVSNQTISKKKIDEWTKIQDSSPVSKKTLLSQLYLASRFKIKKKKLLKPCLVIHSEKDRLVNPNSSIKIAKHLKSKIVCHQEAGHDICLDDPQWLAQKISNFSMEIFHLKSFDTNFE